MPKKIPKADAQVLRYAGFLGHRYVVVVNAGPDARHCGLECSTLEDASAFVSKNLEEEPALYKQIGRGAWLLLVAGPTEVA